MYRTTAAALAMVGLIAQVGLGYQSVDICCPPPCGCEAPPVACCDPCDVKAKAPAVKRPGRLPTPADARKPAPATLPSPPTPRPELPTTTPAPDASAISPPPLNTPSTATDAAMPPVEQPAAPVTPPTEAPPEPAPTTPQPGPFDELFPDTSSETEAQPPSEQPPATETAPTEAPPAATSEQPPTSATETPEPTTEQATPATEEEPATTPDFDELFGPSTSIDVLTLPGGWASSASRPWSIAGGRAPIAGRVTSVTSDHVVLLSDDGPSQSVRYAELADDDLNFLRQQIEARRAQLATQTPDGERLAKQAR